MLNNIMRETIKQTKVRNEWHKLHREMVVTLSRFLEAVAALDGLQRDKQGSSASISTAKTDLENAQMAKEIVGAEFDITRLKRVAALIADSEAVLGQNDYGGGAIFKIIRGNHGAAGDLIQDNKIAPVMLGDAIWVEVLREPRLSSNY